MPTSERTYSFRASTDLVDRLDQAVETWAESRDSPVLSSDELLGCFALEVHRRLEEVERFRGNQSALFRLVAEAFAAAAEKAAGDLAYLDEYEAWAREDDDAHAIRAGALLASAERWRDI